MLTMKKSRDLVEKTLSISKTIGSSRLWRGIGPSCTVPWLSPSSSQTTINLSKKLHSLQSLGKEKKKFCLNPRIIKNLGGRKNLDKLLNSNVRLRFKLKACVSWDKSKKLYETLSIISQVLSNNYLLQFR